MKKKRSGLRSILTVMLTISLLSLSVVGTLILLVANHSLEELQNHIYQREYAETVSAATRLNQDIEVLHTLMYSQLSDSDLLKAMLYMSDNTLHMQYRESVHNVRARIFTMELALDIAENVTIYLPEYRRAITSVSASSYSGTVAAWLENVMQQDPNGVFIDEGQLVFMLLGNVGALRNTNNVAILSRVPAYLMVHYLKHFTTEGDDTRFLLYVEAQGQASPFASSQATALSPPESTAIGTLIAGADSGTVKCEIGGEPFLLTWQGSTIPAVKVCQLTPMALLDEQLQDQRFTILFGNTLAMLIIVGLIGVMYLLIQKPIRSMQRALRHVAGGNFSTRINATWSTEFQQVFDQFNSMAERTQRLIEQEYELRLLNSKAELKQMQYQISPHFLYNTYFILRGMLFDEAYEQAGQVAELMGRYLRYITTSGREYATLGEEIDHAYAYMQIQQIRFGNRVEARFGECPQGLSATQVPKLILQPLIENAFEHGVKQLSEQAVVYVHFAWSEDTLSIIVEDNGQQATDEQILAVQAMLAAGDTAPTDSVALVNIHKRLTITYQNGSRLLVSRSSLGGFCSTILINGVTTHVPTVDC